MCGGLLEKEILETIDDIVFVLGLDLGFDQLNENDTRVSPVEAGGMNEFSRLAEGPRVEWSDDRVSLRERKHDVAFAGIRRWQV